MWARVWTLSSGTWVYAGDVPFSPAAMITAPAQQAINVDRSAPVTWAPGAVINGQQPTYRLLIGTKPATGDLYDSGTITTTSQTVPASAMPAGAPLYARLIVTLGDGSQRRTDNVFATNDTTTSPSTMTWGANGPGNVDASQPFAWTATDLAQAYRLQIQDSTSSTVADSGEIHIPRYFAETLPTGTYTARLGTKLAGTWNWTTTPFTVTANGTSATNEIDAAHWATNYVRHMADPQDYPYVWTEQETVVNNYAVAGEHPSLVTLCADYSDELLRVLKQMNVAAQQPAANQPARFDTFFNALNGHTMVRFYNSADSDWIVLDPTFDIAMKRASDGHWATAADAHTATVNKTWSDIQYVGLGDYGLTLPTHYYVDYPLLYLNPVGSSLHDPTPYLTALAGMPTGHWGSYLARSDQSPINLVVDGKSQSFVPATTDPYSAMFQATTVTQPAGSTAHVTVYTPNWYVFTSPY